MNIAELAPQPLWQHFVALNQVPRPSKQEERVIQFMVDFGRGLHLEVTTDAVGNVLIKKPASPDRQGQPAVVLQGHLDMVCQKNSNTDFDFATQGIRMAVDGDWVRAQGTTLGADNGIGVAAMMAVLESSDLSHPPLEALFTIDEETGMTGAKGLAAGVLSGRYLLNLDTEEEDELTIGCAGGVDVLASGSYPSQPPPAQHSFLKVSLRGLSGGHSGSDIDKGLGNANKLMNRFLFEASQRFAVRIASIDGGGLRNAIPRESRATLAVPTAELKAFEGFLLSQETVLRAEYSHTDPQLALTCESAPAPASVLDIEFQGRLLRTIYAIPCGIHRMSPQVPGLVQTSNNLARIIVGEGNYSTQSLCRGSVDSEKLDLARAIQSAQELLGARVVWEGDYPGWTPRPDCHLVKFMGELYQELFQAPARVKACHAGLECGILGTHYGEMQMISFGPNIRGAHSPDERVQISSVAKFWRYLTRALAKI